MKKVIIYTSKTCGYCHAAKEFFKKNKIKFTEKDVAKKKNAQEAIEKSEQIGIPVILIDDKVIVGFNEGEVKEALGL